MKAITVHQPWATLIAEGLKSIETRRHERFKGLVGKRIAIHASKTYDNRGASVARRRLARGGLMDEEIDGIFARARRDLGKVVCTVAASRHRKLTAHDAPEALCACAGNYGLILDEDVEKLDPPVPAKGGRGIWNWDRQDAKRDEASGIATEAARALQKYVTGSDVVDSMTVSCRGRSATLRKGGADVAKKKSKPQRGGAEDPADDRAATFRNEIDGLERTLAQLGSVIADHAENVIGTDEYVGTVKGARKHLDKALSAMGDARVTLHAASNMAREGALTGEQAKLGDD